MEQIIASLQKLSFAEPAINCASEPTNKQLSELCLHLYYQNTALKNQIQQMNDILSQQPTKMPIFWVK
jgi:hypothetical protein